MHVPTQTSRFRTEQREVTLLFADLRGSTELAGSLQTDPLVCELLGHVMDCLSDAVAASDGFIVDYFGDGMMAMWNAPAHNSDHADRACDAALQMLATLPKVSDEWLSAIETPLRVGIGVHTGSALVGNAGSTRKEKYGPRGPNVNLASRVEAATKELGIPFVATQSTAAQLSNRFDAHRVCRAKMPGVQQAVDLYAVCDCAADDGRVRPMRDVWRQYERALTHFEAGEFDEAAEILTAIDPEITKVPRQFLLQRVTAEAGRGKARRSTDRPTTTADGVMILAAK